VDKSDLSGDSSDRRRHFILLAGPAIGTGKIMPLSHAAWNRKLPLNQRYHAD
jgi:hypothetical protein